MKTKLFPVAAILGFFGLWGAAWLWAEESVVISALCWTLSPAAWTGGQVLTWMLGG